jgi:anti-anti-sigma regulatory factor
VDAVAFSSRTPSIVSIVARPDTSSAWIRLVGEIDMMVEPALAEAADRLNALTLRLIVIDLTAVTFVCSTFANFVAALHRAHPDAEVVLRHPSRMARVIVTGTGLGGFVVMSGDPATPVTLAGPERVWPTSAPYLTTATVPLNSRYPDRSAGTPRSQPGRWEAIDRQPGRTRNEA